MADAATAVPANLPTPTGQPLVDKKLVRAWFGFTLFWMVVAPVFGLIAAQKLDDPEFLRNVEWLQFGRLRIAHVNGVVFGLFSSGIFGFMTYAVPKLTGRPLVNIRAAWIGMVVFNVGVLAGESALLGGYIQAIEAGEYGTAIDLTLTAAFITLMSVYLGTIAKRRIKRMYVSLWYWSAGLLWTGINLPLGNLVLPSGPTGATSAALHGFYLHNVVGLWITPMGIGVIYYILPIAARNKLWSHTLSLIGFWGLAFFYPFNGVHHYIYSPIADWAQTIAIGASLMLLLPVLAFTANMWGTMIGQWRKFTGYNFAVKFGILGALWYLLTCIQGPTQAFREMQELTHFGDYNVGHAHSAVYGAFSIWIMAALYFVYPRVTGRGLWSTALANWHFWLQVVGFGLMFSVLTLSGFVQGEMQQSVDIPWIDTVIAIKPLWIARTLGGTLMDIGLALFAYNMVMTLVLGRKLSEEEEEHDGRQNPVETEELTASPVGTAGN